MKVPFIQKSYTFHRFNERTNTIEFDRGITTTRAMTPAEASRYCHLIRSYVFWIILIILSWVAALVLMGYASCCKLPDWCAGIGITFIGVTFIPFLFLIEFKSDAKQLLMKELSQTGFEEEDAAHESMEEYTQSCADAWRAAHPLEEKIRLAQKSGNCVDIAELVRYCGADLVDKLK